MRYEVKMILAVTLVLTAQSPMHAVAQDYLDALFRASPITATSQAGYHEHDVDKHLDDISPAARQKRLAWLVDFRKRLEALPATQLDREDEADRDLLRQNLELERLELAEAHDYARRCDQPLDTLGTV